MATYPIRTIADFGLGKAFRIFKGFIESLNPIGSVDHPYDPVIKIQVGEKIV